MPFGTLRPSGPCWRQCKTLSLACCHSYDSRVWGMLYQTVRSTSLGTESEDSVTRGLSGGEKAVFDLLLDFHLAATELGTPLIYLDEPEELVSQSSLAGFGWRQSYG